MTEDGKGILYSYISDDRLPDMLFAQNTPGKVVKAVDANDNPVLVDYEKFMQFGSVDVSPFEWSKSHEPQINTFDRYLFIPITEEQGRAMYEKAEALYRSADEYNLYANNCNHVAQQILAAADLDFAPTAGDTSDEIDTLNGLLAGAVIRGDTLSWAMIRFLDNYLRDREDQTVPNAAYTLGAKNAGERGWTAGLTGADAKEWNLFR